MLSISQYYISDITDTQTVDQNSSYGYSAIDLGLFLADFQYISGGQDEDIVLTDAQTLCNLGLCLQMLVFTMHGYCVLRMDQGIDQLDLFLAGMSGYMSILENNICAFAEQLVDDLGDGLFIARDGVGGEDYGIPRTDRDLTVHIVGHTGQGCHTFALASGGDNHLLLIGIILHLIQIHQCILGDIDALQLDGGIQDIYHTAAFHSHFTAKFVCRIDDLLYTIHVGCESCHENSGVLMFFK